MFFIEWSMKREYWWLLPDLPEKSNKSTSIIECLIKHLIAFGEGIFQDFKNNEKLCELMSLDGKFII
jgi:hypothetical protein